jgi:hypothetical protein
MHVRVCVDCGEEFRPEVATCSDCGGRLEDRHDDGAGAGRTRATPAAPAEPDLEPLPGARPLAWSSDARDLVPLADQLMATGLAFRITPRTGSTGFDLCVRDSDREAAARELVPLTGPGSGAALLEAVAPEGDEAEGEPRCPACGSSVPQGATECSGCGLGLGGEPPDERGV